VLESTITEDTLNQEMVLASQAHRESIEKMTAIAPLVVDEDKHQLQIKCAAAEEKADELQRELRILKRGDPAGQLVIVRKELDDLREKLVAAEKTIVRRSASALSESLMKYQDENAHLRVVNSKGDVAVFDLKKRLETAEGELERLKRKRKDSVSPDRVVTGILKRAVASPPSAQKATKMDTPTASAQPTPKKSKTRKNRWNEHATEPTQRWGDLNASGAPLTSFNQDGVKGKKEHSSLAKKRDPVLNNPPSSVRRKRDIINEIEESAKTLSLSRENTSFVFHRPNAEEQIAVTKKAIAYVEAIIRAHAERR
jgi:hypothetical protein